MSLVGPTDDATPEAAKCADMKESLLIVVGDGPND